MSEAGRIPAILVCDNCGVGAVRDWIARALGRPTRMA